MLTAGRQQAGLLAACLVLGVVMGLPALGVPAVVLLFGGILFSILIDRCGARSLALGLLAVAGFLAPMNNLRLGGSVTAADLFLVGSAGMAMLARSAAGSPPAAQPRSVRPDVLAGLLLIAGGVLGSQFSVDLGASLSAIIRFGLAAVGVPLVFVAVAPTRSELRLLAWTYLVGAAVNSVAGVVTYNPMTRGIGFSIHSNHLAAACLLASGLAAGLFLTSSRRAAWTAAALWAVCTVGVLKSGSRAGLLGLAILLALLMVLTGSTRILRWCVTAAIGVGLLMVFHIVHFDDQNAIARLFGRETSLVAQSDFERAQLRAKAIEGIEAHPLTGAGFEEARVAHNVYLQVWGAAGLIGLASMGILWIAALRGVLDGLHGDRWLLGAATAVVSFLIVATASNILWDRYLWFALALVVSGRNAREDVPAEPDLPLTIQGRR